MAFPGGGRLLETAPPALELWFAVVPGGRVQGRKERVWKAERLLTPTLGAGWHSCFWVMQGTEAPILEWPSQEGISKVPGSRHP